MIQLGCFLFLTFLLHILQNVPRLAVEGLADGVESGEADGLGFVGFEDREVGIGDADDFGQLPQLHLFLGQLDIEVDDNHSSGLLDDKFILLGDFHAFFQDFHQNPDDKGAEQGNGAHAGIQGEGRLEEIAGRSQDG